MVELQNKLCVVCTGLHHFQTEPFFNISKFRLRQEKIRHDLPRSDRKHKITFCIDFNDKALLVMNLGKICEPGHRILPFIF